MKEDNAAHKADQLIALILQHQDNVFGNACLGNEKEAEAIAKHIVLLRQKLIEGLSKQAN